MDVSCALSKRETRKLYRHGDRSAIAMFPTDPNQADKWPQGLGWLTTIGMQQHYALGGWLRRQYVDTGFLSRDYKNTEIKIYSSDISRCLMSAYSNLAGLFPPGPDRQFNQSLNWQPIPVHTRPTDEDNTLSMGEICPRYRKLFDEAFYLPDIQQEETENKAFYEWLGHHTGVDHQDLRNIWAIGDTLYCEKTHNFTLAPWVNDTVYEKLRSLVDYQWAYRFKTKEMERLKGGPLLGELIENMQNTVSVTSSTPIKLYMYSAHDSTVAALLRVLQVFNGLSPPYAATVIMELHQNTTGDYHVKLFYKNSTTDSDVVEHLSIPNCSYECPLQQFVALTKPMVPVDWLQECGLSQVSSQNTGSGLKLTTSDCNCVTLRSHLERIFVEIGPGVRNLNIVGHLKVHLLVNSIEQLAMCDVPGVFDIEWGEQYKIVCDLSTRTSSELTSTEAKANHITSSVSAHSTTTDADQITSSVSAPSTTTATVTSLNEYVVSLEPTNTTLHPSTVKPSTTPSYLESYHTIKPTTKTDLNSTEVTCFSCNDMTHLKYCDHIQRCQQDEQCLQATLASGQCFQCCGTDYCNQAGCGDQGFQDSASRGPLCFDCSHAGSKEECDTVKLCASNQACKIEEYRWGDSERLFKLGCEDKLTCGLGGSMRMKRSAPLCFSCCDRDFCNKNCTASQQIVPIG